MLHASDLQHLSIWGRFAFALSCIEQLCAAWQVEDPFVLSTIDAHWQLAVHPKICRWLDTGPFPGSLNHFKAALQTDGLSANQVQSLYHAFMETRCVLGVSCYSALSDDGSMRPLLNVVGLLLRWGVTLPDLQRFRHAAWTGDFATKGWGIAHPRESFAR